MPPNYLAAVLDLLLSDPLALLAEMLVMLVWLHVAVPAGYLIFRALGGEWDGLDAGWRVLVAVHELRRAHSPTGSTSPDFSIPTPSILTHTDHA